VIAAADFFRPAVEQQPYPWPATNETDTDTDSDSVVTQLAAALTTTGATVAVAESATGGLVGSLLTDVPGASEYFDRGHVTYSNDAKQAVLGVSREALEHGAVSAPVAREMAAGARDTAGTTWGLSTTGVAGPSGGTAQIPVGTVYIGLAYASPWGAPADEPVSAQRFETNGTRHECKRQFALTALSTLQTAVTERGAGSESVSSSGSGES
jgi:competence/damage-inducible protein CinA C-terminal domain